ncbi:MAG: 2-vinyl bacteriochlorophyllide hydratase [Burkholderiaceae bacterium]
MIDRVRVTVNINLRQPELTFAGAPSKFNSTGQQQPEEAMYERGSQPAERRPLYTAEERIRRDSSVWTLVQGVLAPIQFLVFLASLFLVLRYLYTGEGLALATGSVVLKTLTLYTIMVTGCIWEKVVFGRYLFAPAFYWEDVFSMLVLALHTAYLAALATQALNSSQLMYLALAAYATYAINAAQFIWKLRAARLDIAQRDAMARHPGLVA